MQLSIIIPCLNEEKTQPVVITKANSALDRLGRLWTLSPCPYSEIGLFWDGRKHHGTILDHSHSMVAGGLLLTS